MQGAAAVRADHGVAALDAQMGAASNLDVMDAVIAFAAAR